MRLGPGIKAAGWPRPRYGGLTGDECCGLPRVRRVARSGNQRGPEDAEHPRTVAVRPVASREVVRGT